MWKIIYEKMLYVEIIERQNFEILYFFKRSLYPQLTSIYECVSKDDREAIRQILSTPTMDEKHAICTWILPRGKRPNRSHMETKVKFLLNYFN
jgi:hypothetical protein